MRKFSVSLVVLLAIMVITSLSMAQIRVEDAGEEEDVEMIELPTEEETADEEAVMEELSPEADEADDDRELAIAAGCVSQLAVQRVWTRDAGGIDKTTFAPGEAIRFLAQLNNSYGAWMLGANGARLAITTSVYTNSSPVNIPPGISTWTWNATAPSRRGQLHHSGSKLTITFADYG